MEKSSFAKLIDIRKERKPSCTLCSNHGIRSSLKGHKHNCPFLRCHCERCVKGRLKRDIMKQQVRLRRKQMKDIVNHPYCGTPVESLVNISSSVVKNESSLLKKNSSVLDETHEAFPKLGGRLVQSVSNILQSPFDVPRQQSYNCSAYLPTPFQFWTMCDGQVCRYNSWPEQGIPSCPVEPLSCPGFSISDNSAFVKYRSLPPIADNSSFRSGHSSEEVAAVLASFGSPEQRITTY